MQLQNKWTISFSSAHFLNNTNDTFETIGVEFNADNVSKTSRSYCEQSREQMIPKIHIYQSKGSNNFETDWYNYFLRHLTKTRFSNWRIAFHIHGFYVHPFDILPATKKVNSPWVAPVTNTFLPSNVIFIMWQIWEREKKRERGRGRRRASPSHSKGAATCIYGYYSRISVRDSMHFS
jgi:hypothetical protein